MSPTQGSKWPSRCLDWVHFLWWRGSCIFYEDQYNHNLDQREGIEKVHQSASNKILFKLDLNQFSLQNFQNETCTTNIKQIECELRRALGLYILTLFWEVQMHYLFVYFLSELSMYSDTGVGWNFHRGAEILKIPDNVGWLVLVHLGVKSDWRSWQIEIAMSSWHRSKSLSPLSNRDECKEGKLLRQSRQFCTNLEAFD